MLGLCWYDFEGLLKERGVMEGTLTIEDFEEEIRTLDLRAAGAIAKG